MQMIGTGVTDALNDPVMHIIIAAMIVSALIGLIIGGIRRALRS